MEPRSLHRWAPDPVMPLMGAALLLLCGVLGALAGVEPGLALGGSLGVAFAAVAFANLAAGVALWAPLAFLYPGVLGKPLLAALGILGLSALAFRARSETELPRWPRPAAAALGLLLAWVVISVSWAPESSSALLDVARFLLSALLFAVVLVAVRDRASAATVVAGFLLGAAAAAAYALVAPPDPDVGRLTGAGASDPNELAASMLPAIAIAGGAAAALRGFPLLRAGAATILVLCFVGFLGAASRGGLVGLAAMLVVAVLASGRWRPAVVLVVAGAIAAAGVYFGSLASPELRARITEPGYEVRVQESRLTLWDVGWRMFEDRPLTGVGVGNFGDSAVDYLFVPGQLYRADVILDEHQPAHNSYLHLYAELGVVGGTLFVALVLLCLGSSLAAARAFAAADDVRFEALARFLLIGQAGMATAIVFFSAQTVNEVWLVLALGPAMLAVARLGHPRKVAGHTSAPGHRRRR